MRRLGDLLRTATIAGTLCLASVPASRAQPSEMPGWVTAWATSMQDPLPTGFPVGNPPVDSPQWAQMFPGNRASDQSFRMIVRPQAAGERIKLKFSNLMGNKPVTLAHMSVAARAEGKGVAAGTAKAVTFGGAERATIPAGREIFSDPVEFTVEPEKDVAVTFHLVGESGPITWHAKAMVTSYMTGPGAGDKAADTSGDSFQYEVRSWLWLSELQAFKADAPDRRTIVAIGNSITDGSGTTVDGHDRWTDFLNRRLRAAGSKNVVVNAGIGGNRITTLRWGPVIGGALVSGAVQADVSGAPRTPSARCEACGEPAIARYERDVLNLPNVSAVIIFEGVNDIGGGGSYGEIIAGIQDLAYRARLRGLKVFAATITPYYGFAYDLVYPDVTRRQVNEWLRTSKLFDGVFDFDAIVRDDKNAARIRADLEAPDHIHLNPKGYSAVADSIPLPSLDEKLRN